MDKGSKRNGVMYDTQSVRGVAFYVFLVGSGWVVLTTSVHPHTEGVPLQDAHQERVLTCQIRAEWS